MGTPDLSEGCCRCGGGLEVMSSTGGVSCLNSSCAVAWTDVRAWQRECIARDIAGTRKMAIGPEYISGGQVKTDVEELVALVEYLTYENVLKNLRLSIEGRNTDAYKERTGRVTARVEIETLQKMYGWVLKQSEEYGRSADDDDIF